MFEKLKMYWAAIRAKKERNEAEFKIRQLRKESEYEKLLDEQLKEKSLEINRVLRESEKIKKLAEANRQIRALNENNRDLLNGVSDGEEDSGDYEDGDEEEDEIDKLAAPFIQKLSNGLLGSVTPTAPTTSAEILSPTKATAIGAIKQMPDEELKRILAKFGL